MFPNSVGLIPFAMLFLLHTTWLEIVHFLILGPSILFAANSQAPPQFPYLDMVRLSLFRTLRLFFISWLMGQFAFSKTKFLLLIYVLCQTWFFPLTVTFSLSSGCITELLLMGRSLKLLVLGSVTSWWRSILTPLSGNMDMSYFSSISSLNLYLPFLSVLLYSHPSVIWGVLLFNHSVTSILQTIQGRYWPKCISLRY